MPSIGPTELIVVLVIALVILGPKRLPEAGRALGRGMREFKNSIGGGSDRPERLAATKAERDDEAERPAGHRRRLISPAGVTARAAPGSGEVAEHRRQRSRALANGPQIA